MLNQDGDINPIIDAANLGLWLVSGWISLRLKQSCIIDFNEPSYSWLANYQTTV